MSNVNFLSPGFWTGLLSFGGMISAATGHPAFGVFLDSPNTANLVTSVVSGALALAAGAMKGLAADPTHPTVPPAAPATRT